MVVVPKKATTIILLRNKPSAEFEAFLLKRHEKSNFMAGNYVYPGGRIDREDHHLGICPHCSGRTLSDTRKILGGGLSPEESLACWIAGIRELFEEAGVLMAYGPQGSPLALKDPEDRKRFACYREQLQKGEISLFRIVQKEKISLALDRIRYYARWITPEARPQRFDTYFFIALHPEGQEAVHDQRETTAGLWITPRQALEQNMAGEIVLSPPTLKTLEDLSRFGSFEELLFSIEEPTTEPILPVLTRVAEEPVIVFPWDPEFETYKRGEPRGFMPHGILSRRGDNTTRVVFRDGRWLPYCRS